MLQLLAERSAEIFGADDTAILLLDGERAKTVAATSSEARVEEMLQIRAGEGPCIEAFQTGQLIRVDTSEDMSERWPRWVESGGHRLYGSVLAAPFAYDGQRLGTMNLLADRADAFDDAAAEAAGTLAQVIAVVLMLDRDRNDSRHTAEQLQGALDTRVVLEQAKGMLAAQLDTTPEDAFQVMRQHARNSNRQLRAIAREVIAGTLDPRE